MRRPVLLVTGGSRGIGLAIIKLFSSCGYQVVTTCTAESGRIAIREHVEDAHVIVWNAKFDHPDVIIDNCENHNLLPDVLICNAGVTQDQLAIRLKPADWVDVYNINTLAPSIIATWAMRKMYNKKGGSILFISSVVAHTGNVGQANYISSKSALEGLTRAFSVEGGLRNVRVNCIAPGIIQTDMTSDLDQIEEHIKRIPLSRVGTPEEIANCALFLARDATYITGQVIHVNGGLFFGG